MDGEKLELTDNQKLKRFEMLYDGITEYMYYKRKSDSITLLRSEARSNNNRPNVNNKLILSVLEYIKAQDLMLIPTCPYVALYIMKNPKWNHLVRQ